MKRLFLHYILPWSITALAIFYARRNLEWSLFLHRLGSTDPKWIIATACIMSVSYLLRAVRWQSLLPHPLLRYKEALTVLLFGFFMNNVLPARAGEVVRAASGGKVTGESRTKVLASIASERLVDGLTLSIFFVVFAPHLADSHRTEELMIVAWAFAAISCGVLFTLLLHRFLEGILFSLRQVGTSRFTHYASNKASLFLKGLTPLLTWPSSLRIVTWSLIIWSIELSTFFLIAWALNASLSLPLAVLFLVTVNFSSLIPAAPGGIGVIEAAATAVLSSAGVEKELALSIVLIQHITQYTLMLVGGMISMWSLKSSSRGDVLSTITSPVKS
jgi:glycosyltransferase 2 family protein